MHLSEFMLSRGLDDDTVADGIKRSRVTVTLIAAILPALNAGNAAATASALSTYFDRIDTNTSQSIDFAEMQSALGGMASNSQLREMFTRLDVDNSGSISRLELILAAVNTQSPAAVASALEANFAALDASVNGLLDFNEVRAALGGMASDSALRQMFMTLDADNSGSLSRLELINASVASNINSTNSVYAALVNIIKPALDAGNAQQVAAALSPYFNSIDTNTSQSIDFNEMRVALGSMASDAQLRAMFMTLDTDNSGGISRLELIKASVDSGTTNQINWDNALFGQANYANGVLDAIRAIQETSREHLNLMRVQLTQASSASFSFLTKTGVVNVNVTNNMLDALNKIVANTFAITVNTAQLATNIGGNGYQGVYAEGGMIGGRPHSQGGTMIEAERGEWIINKRASDYFGPAIMDGINNMRLPAVPMPVLAAGRGANDNSDVVRELRELRSEVARLREENNRGNVAIGQGVNAVGDAMTEANDLKSEEIKHIRRRAS